MRQLYKAAALTGLKANPDCMKLDRMSDLANGVIAGKAFAAADGVLADPMIAEDEEVAK
jgi:hypothetical protein